jgi:hypothetical protein
VHAVLEIRALRKEAKLYIETRARALKLSNERLKENFFEASRTYELSEEAYPNYV